MATCRICGEDRQLVKAHAIPEAFFRVLREESSEPPILVSNVRDQYPKRSPIGIYDQTILCSECESKFGQLDEYGVEVLHQRFEEIFQPIVHNGEVTAFQASGVDQERLLKFMVATLWRASVSSQPFYSNVRLGPHELTAKQAITNPETPTTHHYGVVLSRWDASEEREHLTNGMLSPFREKWGSVNAYRFYFGKTVAYIKVDNRPFEGSLKEVSLLRRDPLVVITRNFDTSKDFRALVSIAKQSLDPRRT